MVHYVPDRKSKFVKKVKKRIPWIEHLILENSFASEVNPEGLEYIQPKGSICLLCRGTKMLCGKQYCPLIKRAYVYLKLTSHYKATAIDGDAPPAVFIGRKGYPYVYAGPMVPPEHGDTSIYDLPETWFGRPLDDILMFRSKLIRGMFVTNVKKIHGTDKLLEKTREMALSDIPVETEAVFKKIPKQRLVLDSDVQPMGPTAPLEKLSLDNVKIQRPVERVYSDTDLRAADGILDLYTHKIEVTKIQRILSVGAMGVEIDRKLVPTRWSITAVDSIISKTLREEIKHYPLINEYRVFETTYLDNRFLILMIPRVWSYELIEAWYPGTLWNPSMVNIGIAGDWEGYKGRTNYASIGGCYYAARLAITEYLKNERRQATVIIFRETLPGNNMPLGVWFVRESVRNALKNEYKKFDSLEEALKYTMSKLNISIKYWYEVSGLLKELYKQRMLTEFL